VFRKAAPRFRYDYADRRYDFSAAKLRFVYSLDCAPMGMGSLTGWLAMVALTRRLLAAHVQAVSVHRLHGEEVAPISLRAVHGSACGRDA